MTTSRSYRMDSRRLSAEATRERILDIAMDAFLDDWYDEVTIQKVARQAGVSGQTVLNHFGGKEQLFAAVATRLSAEIEERRDTPVGDVAAAVDGLVSDYELTGDAVIRLLALEERVESSRALLDQGRAYHRGWVERMFERPDLVPELIVATDVYTWKLLRRDQGLSREATCESMTRIVRALLETKP